MIGLSGAWGGSSRALSCLAGVRIRRHSLAIRRTPSRPFVRFAEALGQYSPGVKRPQARAESPAPGQLLRAPGHVEAAAPRTEIRLLVCVVVVLCFVVV